MSNCILAVGKLKEAWQKSACADYLLRLSRYSRYEVAEVPDEREPDNASDAERQQVVLREGVKLLARLKPDDYVVALAIDGDSVDSPGLARQLDRIELSGRRMVFVIGGSLGLSPDVLRRADWRLSFSRLTFPHPLMRVILLEQLYRARKISAGERYHK